MNEYLKEQIIEYIQDHGLLGFMREVMDFCEERGIF